jgi:hypothetical protein
MPEVSLTHSGVRERLVMIAQERAVFAQGMDALSMQRRVRQAQTSPKFPLRIWLAKPTLCGQTGPRPPLRWCGGQPTVSRPQGRSGRYPQ